MPRLLVSPVRTSTEQGVAIEEIPLGDPRLKEFVHLPWRLYENDPYWTPQLGADLLGSRLLGTKGLLTPEHPYHGWADVTHFLARRGGEVVGRVSAAVNHRFNEYYGSRIGFFGFFETVEDHSVAETLLDAARGWLRERGMEVMRGPGEYSNATHERQGCLVEGFDVSPTMELTHNPPYYAGFFERYGLRKAKDYYAYMVDVQRDPDPRLVAVARRVEEKGHIELREIDLDRFHEEIDLVIRIYNEAWARNWGFLPITNAEAEIIAEGLRVVADPGLVRFAYFDGEPVAVLGAFPDPNWWLRPRWRWYGDRDAIRIARLLKGRRHTPRARLMFFGIRPGWRKRGIDALLYRRMHDYARRIGYLQCDVSLLLEDNDLVIRGTESMGGERYKTYRVYDMDIT